MSNSSDEFDVELYAQQIYRIFKKAISKVIGPFIKTITSVKVLVIWAIVAAALIFGLKQITPEVYKADFIVKPLKSADESCMNMLWDLDVLTSNRDLSALSSVLKMEESALEKLSGIEFKPFRRKVEIDYKSVSDSVDYILITLSAADPVVLEPAQNAVVAFLENNPIYKERLALNTAYLEKLRAKILKDVVSLDSVKNVVLEQAVPRGNGVIYGTPPDVLRVYESAIGLYGNQLRINTQLAEQSSFEILKPIIVPSKPEQSSFKTRALIIALLAFLAAMVHANRKN